MLPFVASVLVDAPPTLACLTALRGHLAQRLLLLLVDFARTQVCFPRSQALAPREHSPLPVTAGPWPCLMPKFPENKSLSGSTHP